MLFLETHIFANFCASFAHEAEQLLRNIPHQTQQDLHIFGQNYLHHNFKIYFWLFSIPRLLLIKTIKFGVH